MNFKSNFTLRAFKSAFLFFSNFTFKVLHDFLILANSNLYFNNYFSSLEGGFLDFADFVFIADFFFDFDLDFLDFDFVFDLLFFDFFDLLFFDFADLLFLDFFDLLFLDFFDFDFLSLDFLSLDFFLSFDLLLSFDFFYS